MFLEKSESPVLQEQAELDAYDCALGFEKYAYYDAYRETDSKPDNGPYE